MLPVASALLVFSLVSPANAADVGDWTGLHVGGNIGYGWGDYSDSVLQASDVDGSLAGAQIGYDWQLGQNHNIVLGVEADFNWSDMQDTLKSRYPQYDLFAIGGNGALVSINDTSIDLDWLSTVRLRAGVLPRPDWLIYATGGFAFGNVKYANFGSSRGAGWTLGTGTEWKFAPQWSAKAEYLYFDLGNTGIDFDGHILRVGVNYHF
ncbi:MAG: outer membrane beta-barrel protein [Zoogloeaceae bacterium]|nr:outer membrane beta-barrel protein [Zoogloeaceae bacterium]